MKTSQPHQLFPSLVSVLPECDKLSTQLTRSDLIQVATGFDSLSNTSKITDDVIKAVFDRYPAMKELSKVSYLLL